MIPVPRPSSRRFGQPWRPWPVRDRAAELTQPLPAMTAGAQAFGRTAPFRLPGGHAWRVVPCVGCGDLPGDYAVRIITIADSRLPHRSPWRVVAAVYLLHDFHDDVAPGELARIVHWREDPNCPCFTRPADAEAAYPYHSHDEEIRG